MMGSDDPLPWRVFVSYTSELRDFPSSGSYVAAVERAVVAAGHVIVDLAGFAPVDAPPAELCIEKVKSCDVYVAVLGMRYGSPVRDRPDASYTELAFDTASEAGMDRLAFLIDAESTELGIPLRALVDREYGDRQDEFRWRVENSGLIAQRFASPDDLGLLVERSLRELASTRQRIDSGIERARRSATPSPEWASKSVNSAPMTAPPWFQDRLAETRLLAAFLGDPGKRLITVIGRGGTGKTAMVCRLLKGLGEGQIPDVDLVGLGVDDIVYLSPNGRHQVDYPSLVSDLCSLLPTELANGVQWLYRDPRSTPTQVMTALLDAFPVHGRVVVFLDGLESAVDTGRERLAESALHEALVTVLSAPEHAVKVVITARVGVAGLLRVQAGGQDQLRLDEGLESPDAENVLRALDSNGALGLRDAPGSLLSEVRRCAHGFPRALEAVGAILVTDPTLTVGDVLDTTRGVRSDDVVEALVTYAYDRLDKPDQQVLHALAVFPAPVSAVGVEFVLRPHNPVVDAEPILHSLVRRGLVLQDAGQYFLRPAERSHAQARIPPGEQGDPSHAYSLAALRARVARYYAQIRTPRETRRSVDDVRPQLAEFDLCCDAGDFDTAASVLADIDDSLRGWGHHRTLIDMHTRIYHRITDPDLQAGELGSLGLCLSGLGDYRAAITLHEESLSIDQEIGNRQGEAADLRNLGLCHSGLGDYQAAITLHEDALRIARQIGDRQGEVTDLGNLGLCHSRRGDDPTAITLHEDALRIARQIGDRQGEAADLRSLGLCHSGLGDYPAAIGLLEDALRLAREVGNRQSTAADLRSLGLCHSGLGDHPRAIGLLEAALRVDRQIGDRQGEAADLRSLGLCHSGLGDHLRAISLHENVLAIDREVGDRQGEAADLGSLGLCHASLGEYPVAISLLEGALAIDREVGDRQGEAADLGSLGLCHASLGVYPVAISLHEDALHLAREIGNRYLEAITVLYLARVWLASGEQGHAVSLFEEAIRVAGATRDLEPEVPTPTDVVPARPVAGGPAGALSLTGAARRTNYPSKRTTLGLLEGIARPSVYRSEARHALVQALDAADAMLVPGRGPKTPRAAMGETATDRLVWAWAQRRVWSLTANRLKQRMDWARSVALGLAIVAATLAVVAVQLADLTTWGGRTLGAAAAISAGFGTLSQRRAGADQIRAWTRARSACEGLTSEVYAYLAGGSPYTGDDREREFGERTRRIVADLADLQRHSRGITPGGRPVPAVTGVGTYLTERVDALVNDHYRPEAARCARRGRRLRAVGDALGVITVVLAGGAAYVGVAGLAAWVPVTTTVGTAVVAQVAAARYDHLMVELRRAAQRLERLRGSRVDTPGGNVAFVDDCEAVITSENRGWMAREETGASGA